MNMYREDLSVLPAEPGSVGYLDPCRLWQISISWFALLGVAAALPTGMQCDFLDFLVSRERSCAESRYEIKTTLILRQ